MCNNCKDCVRFREDLGNGRTLCREWETTSGDIVMDRYYERPSDKCNRYKFDESKKAVKIEPSGLSSAFYWYTRQSNVKNRWRSKRQNEVLQNI